MKNKIAFKLTLYFSCALLLLSLIIGGLFMALFREHTIAIYKADLEKKAVTMANTLAGLTGDAGMGAGMGGPNMGPAGGRQGGYGAYLRFLNDIAMTDVWIVDENLELLTAGHGRQVQYADLPQDAESVVKEVFEGQTTFSEGFSGLLDVPTLTVGTPILSNGKVTGVLLLHAPVEGMDEAVSQGVRILVYCILAALTLSILLSVLFALSFTRPLRRMKDSALRLAEGDYSAKTGVRRKDEIGELAESIDVLSGRLSETSRESEKLNRLRRDFVANISHELRTPVTVIRGSLEALCDGVVTDPDRIGGYHRQMLSESIHLQRLVNDLLDLSRLQNADFSIEMHRQNLCDVAQDAVRSVRHIAREKEVEVRLEGNENTCEVLGDYGRLRQMLLIVLDNAVKFSPPKGVVTVTFREGILSVKDEGPGIPPEDIPYIFDRFYKTRSEENKNGTGLGLAIAKQIAERHHIGLSAGSEPGKGSEFSFRLP